MARDFDGSTQEITLGSDASIDDFATKTMAFWWQWDDSATNEVILCKFTGGAGWGFLTGTDNAMLFTHNWTTNPSVFWADQTTVPTPGTLVHTVVTYDSGNVANNPVFYTNLVVGTVGETAGPPTGAANSEAAATLNMANGTNLGVTDFDGRVQNLVYASGLWDAAQVNRHYWYGTPGGAVAVRHPMITTKTANEGTATAAITLVNSPGMSSIPRTERMYGAMMGCGR